MATLGPSKTPLLRVSRPVSACSKCRFAKIRCDGKLPACTACEDHGRSAECSSANDQFAKGKERSYVASLESRVEKLEKQVLQLKNCNRSVNVPNFESTGFSEMLHVPPNPNLVRSQRREAVVVDDLVSDFGFLSLNATARDFHGFTKDMSFARLVLATSSLRRMPKVVNNFLPPRHTIMPLIEHYLNNIYVLYPFFSETKLFASLDVLYQEGGCHAGAIDHWHVRLVLAIALASLSRRNGDAHYHGAISHAAAAFVWAEIVLQPGSIVGIQAILLIVLYALLDPHHFSSWYLIGVASRVMVDLGLHQDSTNLLLMKDSEVQMRHRVYQSVYTLDRIISMTHLRAFSFTDDSTNVASRMEPNPALTAFTGPGEQNQLFLHQLDPAMQILQLRQMQSSIYQMNFQSRNHNEQETWPMVTNFLQKIQVWAEKIPDVIRGPMKQLFRSEVLYGCIIVLSPPGSTTTNSYGAALLFSYAIEYADILSSIKVDLENFAFYTSNDLLRTSHVAERFLQVLKETPSRILDEGMPEPSTSSSNSSALVPPSLPNWSVGDVLNKAVICLERLEQTLENLGQRFDKPDALTEYKIKSTGVRLMLDSRREQWSRRLRRHVS